jgi:quinol monooxygenase YgiN
MGTLSSARFVDRGDPMYGTVARCIVKPGHFAEAKAALEEWGTKLRPVHKGVVAAYTFQTDVDPDVVFIVAICEDKASYQAQGDNPDQGAWFERLREHLADDPEWNDGEVLTSA